MPTPEGTMPAFQFHKGTIKTEKSLTRCAILTIFQFHKGTIKTKPLRELLSAFPISIP